MNHRAGAILIFVASCVLLIASSSRGDDQLQQADALLNRIYQQMMSLMPPAQRQQLLHTQRAWVAFKEKNDETLRSLVAAGAITEATREAVLVSELHSRKAEIVISFGRGNQISPNFANADSQLNEAYQACLRSFPAPEQQKLREAQRLWIIFRDLSRGSAALITMHRVSDLRQMAPSIASVPPVTGPPGIPPDKPAAVDPNTPDPFATARSP